MTSSWPQPGHAGVKRVLRLIRKRAHLPIAVAHLIRASGMSSRGLHKAFMNHTGKGPGSMLREFRMKLAEQLLRASRIPIEEVLCGYQRTNSFYVAFRRHAAVSPGVFRHHRNTGGECVACSSQGGAKRHINRVHQQLKLRALGLMPNHGDNTGLFPRRYFVQHLRFCRKA